MTTETKLDGIEAEVRRLTDREFKDHVITEMARDGVVRCWRCAKPGTGNMSFQITTVPGALFIRGDIGDLMVERAYDMLPFCRRSCDSISYFAEKVPHAIPTKEYSPEKTEAWIREQIANLKGADWEDHSRDEKSRNRYLDVLVDALDDLESEEHGEQHMYSVTSEVWQGDDPPDFLDWNRNFLICRDAIRWFAMNHDEPAIPAPENVGSHGNIRT